MKMLAAAIVIGPVLLTGALPAAGQSTIRPGSGASVPTPAGVDAAADRNTYKQKARDEMQEWQRKPHDFETKAAVNGSKVGDAAKMDLNEAWARTKAASRQLETASVEGWDSAKTSFEAASRELAVAWDRI